MSKRNSILKLTGTTVAVAAMASTATYFVTKYFVKAAMERKETKLFAEAEKRFAEKKPNEAFLAAYQNAAKNLAEKDLEEISLTASDGTVLIGHWYSCDCPKRLILAMHGWRSSWNRDFGLTADFLHENHCSILFAEQRGQCSSGGDYMGFGLTERYDCLEWIKWLTEQDTEHLPVYLHGVSMGAATVLMAAGLDLPENIHGIIADCGFTSPRAIWKYVSDKNLHIPYDVIAPIADGMFKQNLMVAPDEYSTVTALENGKTPVLFIHGTDDQFVPVEMTYENYKACSAPKRLFVVPGADHGMSCHIDKDGYENAVKAFWDDFDEVKIQ